MENLEIIGWVMNIGLFMLNAIVFTWGINKLIKEWKINRSKE